MEIKICCEDMKYYVDRLYIEHDGKSISIDTSLYEENEVKLNYCPFCGKKTALKK